MRVSLSPSSYQGNLWLHLLAIAYVCLALLVIAGDIGREVLMLVQKKTAHVCSPISED